MKIVDTNNPAELPADINALRSQQFRWTKGAIETAKKLYPKVIKSRLPFKEKFQSLIHLWSNIAYPFILVAALLNPPVAIIKETGDYDPVFKFMSIFIFAFGWSDEQKGNAAPKSRGRVRSGWSFFSLLNISFV